MDVQKFVENNIGDFHEQQLKSLEKLDLFKVLRKKNPYLFKAKSVFTAEQIIRGITDAYISSQEETNFGTWLEGLAIYINKKVYGGTKSSTAGIDLEFEKENIRYIVSIKSGPNWANGAQRKKLIVDFNSAIHTLKTSNSKLNVIAVEGCCYGRDNKPYKKQNYFKYCGQRFWEFISNNPNLYIEIIEPLGHKAKQRNELFIKSYSKVINKFTRTFTNQFCDEQGGIDWEKLVKLNSGIAHIKIEK